MTFDMIEIEMSRRDGETRDHKTPRSCNKNTEPRSSNLGQIIMVEPRTSGEVEPI